MRRRVAALVAEHRAIEAALEAAGESLAAGSLDAAAFHEAWRLLALHYAGEEDFLAWLSAGEPAVAAKLRGQHAEALEIAARLAESLAAGQAGDVAYLGRRLVAIARHNIVEEERDVFPRVRED